METIVIDGKTYQLIPIETDDAAKKALGLDWVVL